jgi:hypothetical protein
MKKGYEQTYDWVISLLQHCDFAESAKRLNLKLVENNIEINFLERIYTISKEGIGLSKENLVWISTTEGYEYNLKSVLGYYVLSEADVEPENDFCTLPYFSHGIFINTDWKHDRLGDVFGKDYAKFCEVARKLAMSFEGEKSSGQYIWKYLLLPKMPIKIIYYEGDEEYPTKLQILYDKTAIKLYKFEPLAVLHACFIEGLAGMGEMDIC